MKLSNSKGFMDQKWENKVLQKVLKEVLQKVLKDTEKALKEVQQEKVLKSTKKALKKRSNKKVHLLKKYSKKCFKSDL